MKPRVYKQKGGRVYRGRFKLANDLKPREIPLHTPYKHVAEANLLRIVRELEEEASGLIAPKPLRDAAQKPLVDHLASFVEDMVALGRCKKHIQHTRNRLARLFEECAWRLLRDVNADGFARWRSQQKTFSAKTLNEYLGHANALLNWCVRNGRLVHNPLVTVQKVETRGKETVVRRALAQSELELLVLKSGRRGLVYWLAAWTGLRRGEVKALAWADVQLDVARPHILARASTTKNKRSAVLPLLPPLADALRAFRGDQPSEKGKVFRLGVPSSKMLVRDLAAVGIEEVDTIGRRIDFHALRHTFASLLAAAGVSQRVAMELMRHSDPRLTAKTYTDVTALPMFSELEKLTQFSPPPLAPLNSDQKRQKLSLVVQTEKSGSENGLAEVVPIENRRPDLTAVGQSWQNAQLAERGGFEPPVSF